MKASRSSSLQWLFLRMLVMLIAWIIPVTQIGAASPQEFQIKAVFLYNFALFVDWPPNAFSDPHSPVVIGILGKDPFGTYLDEAVKGEKINDRTLTIHRYTRIEDVKDCQILYISRSESNRLETILATLRGKPILTVGDFEGFARSGGMIRFVNESNKVRLRINLQSATAAGLTLSSKLLRPATIVTSGED